MMSKSGKIDRISKMIRNSRRNKISKIGIVNSIKVEESTFGSTLKSVTVINCMFEMFLASRECHRSK